MKYTLSVALFAVALWSFGWFTQKSITGTLPTRVGSPNPERDSIYEDAALLRLRKNVEASPESIEGWRALATAIGDKMRAATPQGEAPPETLAIELLDVLGEILARVPEDRQSLISMANLSFNLTAFPKAVEMYERYLKVAPTDDEARATYASALMFVGRGDEAIRELQAVVSRNSMAFQPRALLAVALAQAGRMNEAKVAGDAAAELAPSSEAREKLVSFLKEAMHRDAPAEPGTAEAAVENVVKKSSVAGPKLVRVNRSSPSQITITMKDFPMSAMPPFARDKFVSGIVAAAEGAAFKGDVVIVDEATGTEMHKVNIGSSSVH